MLSPTARLLSSLRPSYGILLYVGSVDAELSRRFNTNIVALARVSLNVR